MCGLKGHSSNIVPPLNGKDNNTVFDDVDKANILNDTFINQNTSAALENFPFGPTQTKAIFTMTHVKASEVKNCAEVVTIENFHWNGQYLLPAPERGWPWCSRSP